jgi:antitoxin component of MazEF toxin-antitoxin module
MVYAIRFATSPYHLRQKLAEARVKLGDVGIYSRRIRMQNEPSRKKYELTELVAGITRKNRHQETDWGYPQGEESW